MCPGRVTPRCCLRARCVPSLSVICKHSGLSRHWVGFGKRGDRRELLHHCVGVYDNDFLRGWRNLAMIVGRRFFLYRLRFLRRRRGGGPDGVPGRYLHVRQLDNRSLPISGCFLGPLYRTKNDSLFQFHSVRPFHSQIWVLFRSASVGMEKCICEVCLIFGAVLPAVVVPLLLFVAVPASPVPESHVGPLFFWRIPSVVHNWWN